ncbi:MAG: IS1182 family transposase [Candidatus Bathyarchaeota archaeon]|nr:IS1182 family transposase [Candidatus Termiticorpusculum sp.]
MEYIAGEHRTQSILFPDLLDNYVSQESPVRVIDAYIGNLNLKNLGFTISEAQTGRPPYNPADLLKLYIYGYLNKIRSSRRLEQETKRNLELMWLLKKLSPDHKTIANFRHNNPTALKNTFKDFARLCIKLDLYSKELIAIDGSKFKANNSKDNNLTKNKIAKRITHLDKKIDEIHQEMDNTDQKETIAEEKTKPKTEQQTKEILNQHLAGLNARKGIYQDYTKELEQTGETQKSLTDPDSRLMKQANGNSDVCYNIQTAVDAKNKLIVDFEVTNAVNDFNQLSGMAKKALEVFEVNSLSAVVDAGFDSATDIANCLMHGVEVHIAGVEEFDVCVPCSKEEAQTGEILSQVNGRCVYIAERNLVLCPMGRVLYPGCYSKKSKDVSFYNSAACHSCVCRCVKGKRRSFAMVMREEKFSKVYDESNLFVRQVRVKSDKGLVLLRKEVVEHPFGVLKRVMDMGYCLLKGFDLVRGEFSLAFLAYNLKRVINLVGVPKLIQAIQAQ